MRVAAILTAAGSGTRLGQGPKALVPLAGEPLVRHAARRLLGSGVVHELVVTVPAAHRADVAAALEGVGGPAGPVPVVVDGGPTRQASVAAGLAHVPGDVEAVLVHDAARALTPPAVVRRVVAALADGARAVVPVVPVTDSVVRVADGAAEHVDRRTLRAVQTPQGFDRDLLVRAHAAAADRAGDEAVAATDDASLCALLGERVVVVEGDDDALKITRVRDLAVARTLVGEEPTSAVPA